MHNRQTFGAYLKYNGAAFCWQSVDHDILFFNLTQGVDGKWILRKRSPIIGIAGKERDIGAEAAREIALLGLVGVYENSDVFILVFCLQFNACLAKPAEMHNR